MVNLNETYFTEANNRINIVIFPIHSNDFSCRFTQREQYCYRYNEFMLFQ